MALFDPKAKIIAQLQKAIDEKIATINRYFDEIGRLYYGQYRDDQSDVSKDINARCEAISTLYLEVEAYKLKILFEKGLKVCANCKRENPLEHMFCSSCGHPFPVGSDKQVEVPTSLETPSTGEEAEGEETQGQEVEMDNATADILPEAASEDVETITSEEESKKDKSAKKPAAKKATDTAKKSSAKKAEKKV